MTVTTDQKLALHGGRRAVPEGTVFHVWPEVTRDDEELVLASLRQSSHAFGPHARQLQDEFAAWNGSKYCMATNSGTAALHMCVAGCDIGPGDEVITTALSWTSSASAIVHHSASRTPGWRLGRVRRKLAVICRKRPRHFCTVTRSASQMPSTSSCWPAAGAATARYSFVPLASPATSVEVYGSRSTHFAPTRVSTAAGCATPRFASSWLGRA